MIFLTLLVINLLLILILHNLAFKLNLIDFPNSRKIHQGEIPLVGGIAIYATIIIGVLLTKNPNPINFIVFTSAIVVIIGILDDIINIDFKIRFFCQFLASLIILAKGIYITDLSFINMQQSQILIYFFIPFTILAVLGLTNAMNFIDGIDGLSSLLFLKSLIILIILINLENPNYNPNFLYLLFISIIPFIIFNLGLFKNYKIFLGDSGSTFLGFILAWMLIYYTQISVYKISPIIVVWIAPLIVFDFFGVFISRIINRSNPFIPDNNHLHFILLKKYNKTIVLLLMLIISFSISIIGLLIHYFLGMYPSLFLFLLLLIIYLLINYKLKIIFV